jgi:class 3 adenylate cyclase
MSSQLQPEEVVDLLNGVFTEFDWLVGEHGLEKIKTIGDAYMVAGGIPTPRPDHCEAVVDMASAMLDVTSAEGWHARLRIGIDTGPVVAGVIGRRKFIYDLWGDTVNTASRMESHGVPGRIQVTERVVTATDGRFRFEARGPIEVKGKGPIPAFLLVGPG